MLCILRASAPLAVLIADGLVACAWPAADSRAARRPPDSRILIESGPMLAPLGAGVIVAATMAPQFRTPYVMIVRPAMYAIVAILLSGCAFTVFMFLIARTAAGLGAIVRTRPFTLLAR